LFHDYHVAYFEIFPQVKSKRAAKHTSENFLSLLCDLFLRFEKLLLEVVVKLAL
jgi:hypothetical protein